MKKFATLSAVAGCLACAPAAFAASSPVVTPHPVTAITATTAVLRGVVNPNGTRTTYDFDLGATTALGTLTPVTSAGAGAKDVAVKAKLNALTPGTTYYYVLVATNAAGTSTSTLETFKTGGAPPPIPVTGGAEGVEANQVTLTGLVTTQGVPTTYYFQYGLETTYGLQTNPVTIPASAAPVPVSTTFGGLAPGATFHYRLVATHGSLDASAGQDEAVETLPFPVPVGVLHVHTSPRKDSKRPFRFTTSGYVHNPAKAATPNVRACNAAIIAITFRDGKRVVGRNHTTIDATCRFVAPVSTTIRGLPHVARGKHGAKRNRTEPIHLRVEVQFEGSPFLAPAKKFETITVR